MQENRNDLSDNIIFEDGMNGEELTVSSANSISEIEKELKDAKYYFTPQSYKEASGKLRSILADRIPDGKEYPKDLLRLMCFVHTYPIYEKRRDISWKWVPFYVIGSILIAIGVDLSIGLYVRSGLILRFFTWGITISLLSFFGYALMAALTTAVSYWRCGEARRLFRTQALYTGQGKCVYMGKNSNGTDVFQAEVGLPFSLPSPWALLKSDADVDIENLMEDLAEENGFYGIAFSVGKFIASLLLFLYFLNWYDIGLIDFLWFLW